MQSDKGLNDDSSDYGSDFLPDEEELLNELFARVDAAAPDQRVPTIETTTPSTITTNTTQTTESAQLSQRLFLREALHELQPLADPLIVADIEDYEVPHSVRIPRVLGRAWSPASQRDWQQKQQQLQHQEGLSTQRSCSSPPSSSPIHVRYPISGML